mmetsp:Transcript_120840/g.375606  ORF Transcript_120840/g.375606 Transcript_120840/m.375606 type:complete len:286 (+) Transcript_120840:595-1452(+)
MARHPGLRALQARAERTLPRLPVEGPAAAICQPQVKDAVLTQVLLRHVEDLAWHQRAACPGPFELRRGADADGRTVAALIPPSNWLAACERRRCGILGARRRGAGIGRRGSNAPLLQQGGLRMRQRSGVPLLPGHRRLLLPCRRGQSFRPLPGQHFSLPHLLWQGLSHLPTWGPHTAHTSRRYSACHRPLRQAAASAAAVTANAATLPRVPSAPRLKLRQAEGSLAAPPGWGSLLRQRPLCRAFASLCPRQGCTACGSVVAMDRNRPRQGHLPHQARVSGRSSTR